VLTSTTTGSSTVTNTYDDADQLTKQVSGSTTTPTYDADGNLTKDATGSYVYDALDRVKSATVGANTFTFVYDAEGNRTVTNKNGTLDRTSRWDLNNPLAQIATETGAAGALLGDYLYNPAGAPQALHSTTGTFYLLHDRQDSVNAVYDSAGKPRGGRQPEAPSPGSAPGDTPAGRTAPSPASVTWITHRSCHGIARSTVLMPSPCDPVPAGPPHHELRSPSSCVFSLLERAASSAAVSPPC
jgi:uncharacterized protein RhaS with RHS repeats